MSRFQPAAVMSSFVKTVRTSVQNWRRRKRNEIYEDISDQLMIETLESRIMLDADSVGDEEYQSSQDAWFMQLPSDVATGIVDYLDSEGTTGSLEIWMPTEQERQADPDPATGQVSQDQIDELDLNRLIGSDSRVTVENTEWDKYVIDQSLWTGLDITTEVKSFAQDNGSYVVVLKRTERDRSADTGGGGTPGGPGSPGGGGSNPYEQIETDILTTVVQTDDANVVSQIELNQSINADDFDRWLTLETDFTFRYEILSDDGFSQREISVTTDFQVDLDVHWMGLYEHVIVDEPAEDSGNTGDSEDQLPLGETEITINYDLIVDASFTGDQSYQAFTQLGPGDIGSATFENSGQTSGTISVISGTTSTNLYTRGDLDYDAGQFGIRAELNSNDDYTFTAIKSYAYTGNGTNTHGSTDASFTSGQYNITSSRTTTVNDQSETEYSYESYLDESESTQADARAEADAADEDTGEETPDTGSDESVSYYIPSTTQTHTKNYWKAIPANAGSAQYTSDLTIHYADGRQDLTYLTSSESSVYDTTGDFYQSSFYHSVFSKDASTASFFSTSDSLLSSDEWIGTTSSQSDLTFTPNADGEFVATGFIDDQSSYTSGLVSSTVGTALVVASVSAALRSDEEETTDGGSGDPGSGSSSSDDSTPLPSSAENYLKNHLAFGFSATGSTDPTLHDDLAISYRYSKSSDSSSSNTQHSPGHNNIRTEFEDQDTMRVISSKNENYLVLNQGGTSSFASDSIVTDGDYTEENGSLNRDHSSTSSNWHVDSETVTSSSDLTSVLDAIEIETPDGTTDGSDTTGSGSSDPNAGSTTTEDDSSPNNYKTDVTTVGTTSFEQNLTGEYSYSETESFNQTIVDQRDEQESGDWTHLEVNDSSSSTFESTTEGDSWSKYEVQYFGDVSGGIPIEGRGQSIWDRNQSIGTSETTDSSETEFSNSYRYLTHSAGQSLGEGTDLPGGAGTVQSATETTDVGESYSATATSGTTTSISVDEDLYTLTHRVLEDSGSGGAGGPGGTSGGPGSDGTSSGPAPIEGTTFTYKSTFADGEQMEVTVGGHSDVTITTNYWDNLGDIQSQLELGDTYSDGQGNLGNNLVFLTGISPDGSIIVGPDAPNVSTTASSNVVHKVYFKDDGRYDVMDGTETFSKTTKNKRTINKDDSNSDATENLPNSTRVTTFEILDDNVETSTSTVTYTDTYDDYGTKTQVVEKLYAGNSGTDTSGDGSEEENTSLDPNDWLSQYFGVEVNAYGTGSHTAETRVHGNSNTSIQTRETVVDTQNDGSGDSTRITSKTYTEDKVFDQTDTTEKTFDSNGYLEIKVTEDAVAGNNKLEKHQLIEDEFTASYTKTESDGGVLETTRTGNSTSTSDELFQRSVSGSLIYNISYDGTAQDVVGSIVTTLTGTGDSDADDTQTVEKTKSYTGTFSSGDLDPGIVDGHVPLSIQGGGTETGTIEYTIKKTEIQELADNFDGTMISTITCSINSDGEFAHDQTESYTNAIDGTKKARTIAENNYQIFSQLGGTPSIDTGLVLVDSYNTTITDNSLNVYKRLGYSVTNGYGSYNFIGTPIDAQIGTTFVSIPEADDSYASVTAEGATSANYQQQSSDDEDDEDDGTNPQVGNTGPGLIPNRFYSRDKSKGATKFLSSKQVGELEKANKRLIEAQKKKQRLIRRHKRQKDDLEFELELAVEALIKAGIENQHSFKDKFDQGFSEGLIFDGAGKDVKETADLVKFYYHFATDPEFRKLVLPFIKMGVEKQVEDAFNTYMYFKSYRFHRDVVKAASFIEEHAPDAIAVVDAVRNEDFSKLNDKQLQLAFKVNLLYTRIKIALVHLAKDQIKDPKQLGKIAGVIAYELALAALIAAAGAAANQLTLGGSGAGAAVNVEERLRRTLGTVRKLGIESTDHLYDILKKDRLLLEALEDLFGATKKRDLNNKGLLGSLTGSLPPKRGPAFTNRIRYRFVGDAAQKQKMIDDLADLNRQFDGIIEKTDDVGWINGRLTFGKFDPETGKITFFRGSDDLTELEELLHWRFHKDRLERLNWSQSDFLRRWNNLDEEARMAFRRQYYDAGEAEMKRILRDIYGWIE